MSEVIKTVERQSAWQKRRKEWSWSDKIRMAEAIRDSIVQLRRARSRPIPPDGPKPTDSGQLKPSSAQ